MEVSYERLLAHVARLYERHEAAREGRTSFNVFDVLRSPSDFRNLNHDGLRLLMSEKSRSAFAKTVAAPMKELWRQIKRSGLADGMGPAS